MTRRREGAMPRTDECECECEREGEREGEREREGEGEREDVLTHRPPPGARRCGVVRCVWQLEGRHGHHHHACWRSWRRQGGDQLCWADVVGWCVVHAHHHHHHLVATVVTVVTVAT